LAIVEDEDRLAVGVLGELEHLRGDLCDFVGLGLKADALAKVLGLGDGLFRGGEAEPGQEALF
jgi:hypothetical protein